MKTYSEYISEAKKTGKEEVYTKGVKFVPGAILHAVFGYSMTLNTFYVITKRSGNTIYTTEIGSSVVKGDFMRGEEVPNQKDVHTAKQFRSRITGEDSVKIDGKYARIWDGHPKHYDRWD